MEVAHVQILENGYQEAVVVGSQAEIDYYRPWSAGNDPGFGPTATRCGGHCWSVVGVAIVEREAREEALPVMKLMLDGPTRVAPRMKLRRVDESLSLPEILQYLQNIETLFRLTLGTDAIRLYELLARENQRRLGAKEGPDQRLSFLMRMCACLAISQKELRAGPPNAEAFFELAGIDNELATKLCVQQTEQSGK